MATTTNFTTTSASSSCFFTPQDDSMINPNFDVMGALDTMLPIMMVCHVVGLLYQRLERRYLTPTTSSDNRGGGKLTSLSFTSCLARFSMLVIPHLPYRLVRTRWDWLTASPTIYEFLAYLYHYHDLGGKESKWRDLVLKHHFAALFVLWPSYRYFETNPYPVSALSFALAFEVASGFVYLSYVLRRNSAPIMKAWDLPPTVKVEEVCAAITILCWWGQRAMRWYSLLSGLAFGVHHLHDLPYTIPGLVIPSVLFEMIGLREFHKLPAFPYYQLRLLNVSSSNKPTDNKKDKMAAASY